MATLLAAMIITPPSVHGGMEKLKRAKRDVRVTGMYFVHMNERATVDETRELISEYESMNNETFLLSSYGILDEVAHGFSCKMSKQALDEVCNRIDIIIYFAVVPVTGCNDDTNFNLSVLYTQPNHE